MYVGVWITLIASPTYVKSRHCDQFLMFLCKNVTEQAHAQLSKRSGTFFRACSKLRRLNVNEALFREDDYCLCRVHSPTILRCPEDFFLCKSSRMNLRGQKCLTTPEPSKQRVKKPVRQIKKQIYVYENKAVYTATEVACGWAGAVMQKPPVNAKKS